MVAEDTVDMLAKDCFMDTLCDRQQQVHMKQAAPKNMQKPWRTLLNLRRS